MVEAPQHLVQESCTNERRIQGAHIGMHIANDGSLQGAGIIPTSVNNGRIYLHGRCIRELSALGTEVQQLPRMEAVVPELDVGKNVTHFVTYLLDVLLSSDSFLHVLPQGRHDATHDKPDLNIMLCPCEGE